MSKSKKTPKSKTVGEIAQRMAAVATARSKAAAANADSIPKADPDRVPLSEVMKKATKTAKGSKAAMTPTTPKAPKVVKEKKVSGLDAAAQVLAKAGQPMRCKDMVDKMLADGLWKTDGKTPAATIYSAILREITVKGADSRFKKTDRGLFTVNGK